MWSNRPDMHTPVRHALISLADDLGVASIPWQLGGSGLLCALGLVDTVRDLDVVFPGSAQPELAALLERATGFAPEFDDRQERNFHSGWRARHEYLGVELDMTAEITFDFRGGPTVRLPFEPGGTWDLEGRAIPLGPLPQWLLIYRHHNPVRAALLAPLVSDDDWNRMVSCLGVDLPPG